MIYIYTINLKFYKRNDILHAVSCYSIRYVQPLLLSSYHTQTKPFLSVCSNKYLYKQPIFRNAPLCQKPELFPFSTKEADHIPFLAPQIVFVLAHDLFSVSSNDSGRVAKTKAPQKRPIESLSAMHQLIEAEVTSGVPASLPRPFWTHRALEQVTQMSDVHFVNHTQWSVLRLAAIKF